MHARASFIAVEMAPPSRTAATAMAAPTIARINAYSAAEAPASSRSMLMNVVIAHSFPTLCRAPLGKSGSFAVFGNEAIFTGKYLMEPNKSALGRPPPSAQQTESCDSANKLSTNDFKF